MRCRGCSLCRHQFCQEEEQEASLSIRVQTQQPLIRCVRNCRCPWGCLAQRGYWCLRQGLLERGSGVLGGVSYPCAHTDSISCTHRAWWLWLTARHARTCGCNTLAVGAARPGPRVAMPMCSPRPRPQSGESISHARFQNGAKSQHLQCRGSQPKHVSNPA